MELQQYEGLPPFQHFSHSGKCGHASVLTYDASLAPAIITVSSIMFRLNEQTRPPKGLCSKLRLKDGLAENPICNTNGDRFYRTDNAAVGLSNQFELLGSDVVQSHMKSSTLDNPQRFDVFDSFEDYQKARLVFYAHQSRIVAANMHNPFGSVEFHCFQPFVRRLSKSIVIYAYFPLGRAQNAFFVVDYGSDSKVLRMNLGLSDTTTLHLNHWAFFVETKEESDDSFLDEEETETSLVEANFYMTNLCNFEGSLHFFYSEEVFCLPRLLSSVCAECFAETNMSQLCGGYFCYSCQEFEDLTPEAYKIAMEAQQRKNKSENAAKGDFHFLGSQKSSAIELMQWVPKTISSSTMSVFRDTYVVRVNGHIFDAKVDFGRVMDVFESSIPEPEKAIAFSPLFGRSARFFYVTNDGKLFLQDETNRRDFGRIVPKEAENLKLFLPLGNTVYCYWTVGRKHYMTNLETFLAEGILDGVSREEEANPCSTVPTNQDSSAPIALK